MTYRVYQYPKCSTCRNALRWLDAKGADYQTVDVTLTPPTKTELEMMLAHYNGDLRRLFNTSGTQYRELRIKDKLPAMSPSQAIEFLSRNGKLIKRPFLIAPDVGLIGFKESEWTASLP